MAEDKKPTAEQPGAHTTTTAVKVGKVDGTKVKAAQADKVNKINNGTTVTK